MGIALKELIQGQTIDIKQLQGKIICVDTSVLLYQFLTTIRQSDGAYFTDTKGNVTSHLIGMNARISKLMQAGLKLIFVFDGKPPALKYQEIKRRHDLKEQATAEFSKAKESHDFDAMKRFASRSVKVTPEIIQETKRLIDAFGLPIVEAPSEAEAQAAHMVKKGHAYAVATQDTDALMFGATKIIKNLSLLGKHKRQSKLDYETYSPELITIDEVFNTLGVDQEQFILLAILVGTDFNPGGIKGIGPKNALKLVKEYKTKVPLQTALQDKIEFNFDDVYNTIKAIPVIEHESPFAWKAIQADMLIKLLVTDHDFSKERVDQTIQQLQEYTQNRKQTNLFSFAGK